MPGTLRFDESGTAHGTGTKRYFYESGDLKLEDAYLAGDLNRSRWYGRDGELIEETRWKAGSGTGIYLREDGTIRSRYQYVKGLAEGQATFFADDGSVERVATFRDGVEINDGKTQAPRTLPP
jgi:antitoxin component YwqK of YwqJK toxin-antitoxin module